MLNIIYYINGVEIKAPANHKEVSFELNFDQDSPDVNLLTTNWRFINENADILNDYVDAGLTGSFGIFQGVPFDLTLQDGTTSEMFKMYLDLTDGAEFSSYDVKCNSKEYSKIEWLNDVADSFTFEYLHEETTHLPSSLFVSVPYVISTVPNYREAFMATLGVTFIVIQIESEVAFYVATLAAGANPFATPSEAIRFCFHIVYTIGLIISLIKLINDIIDLIIQPVKYHKGMYVRDLIDAGCAHLGLTFESTILKGSLWKDLYLLPEKYENPPDPDDDRILGFLSPSVDQKGYYKGTFGQLLREMKAMFNAKIIIQNGVLRLERVDWNNSTTSYIIPDIRQDFFGYNTDEFNSNYLVEFRYDVNDKNTVQEYTGTIFQATLEPWTWTDTKLRLMKGYKNVAISFALGKRKEDLTGPEKILDFFFDIGGGILNGLISTVNAGIDFVNFAAEIIGTLGDILSFFGIDNNMETPEIQELPYSNLGQIINNRIGMLLLENDSVLVPKLLLVQEGSSDVNNKIYADHKDYLSARYLYENYHFINSFAPTSTQPNGNQWIRKKISRVPFTLSDFVMVKENNRIFDVNGNTAKIENLKWNPWDNLADIEYRINQKYTNNLITKTSEGQGF